MDIATRMFNAANALGIDEVLPEYMAAATKVAGQHFESGSVVMMMFEDGSIVIALGDMADGGIMAGEFVGFSGISELLDTDPDLPVSNGRQLKYRELLRETVTLFRRFAKDVSEAKRGEACSES